MIGFLKQTIIEKIIGANQISLFVHEAPDFDALGAAFGLKNFIKNFDSSKNVEIIGIDLLDDTFSKGIFPFEKHHVSNDFISRSLGIVLDTANSERILSGRHKYCKELIRIDHHPKIETIGNLEWVDPNYPATCQMITEMLFSWEPNFVTSSVAGYLYAGLITDTGRFLHSNTLDSTYESAAKLIRTGFDREKVHNAIYLRSLKEVKFDSYIIERVLCDYNLGFAYAIIPKNAFNKFDIDLRMSYVHVLNNIQNLEVWMTVYYDDVLKVWKGSLRSRRIPINNIAEKFNGGGHPLAAAFKLKNKSQYKQIVDEMIVYLQDKKGMFE